MSGLIGLLSTDDLALCFYGRRRCKRDVRWLSGTFQRMHQSFESDGDSGFEWIVGYALCLFQQLDNKRNEVALACLCIASKMLDDRCAEIGDGVWEAQLPGLDANCMARAEAYVAHALGFRLRVTQCALETCLEDCAVMHGVAVRV